MGKKEIKILKDSLFILAISHDFGKCTTEFQNKIRDQPFNNKLSRHGLISSLFGYFLFNNYSEKHYSQEFLESSKDLLMVYSSLIFKSIRRHHTDFKDNEFKLYQKAEFPLPSFKEVQNQIDNIIKNNKKEANEIYINLLDYRLDFCQDFKNFLDDLHNNSRRNKIYINPDLSSRFCGINKHYFFYIFNLMHSLLLEADKMSAANIQAKSNIYERKIDLKLEWIENYKNQLNINKEKEFNKFREKLYTHALEKLEQTIKKEGVRDKIYTLNAPTGSGKTLTMFGIAIRLNKYLREEEDINARIIYALPFISIIDQNFKVFENLIKTNTGKKPKQDILLPFHHLSDKVYESQGEEELTFTESSFLIENWYSEIIITTFYQIFKSIFTNKNYLLQKYDKLVNAIIILDEIQAIPTYLHNIVRQTLNILTKKFNVIFLIGTATLPNIFEEQNQPQLINLYEEDNVAKPFGGKNKLFHRFNLNTELFFKKKPNNDSIKIDSKKIDFNNLIKYIDKDIKQNNLNNFLVVLNTIRASKTCYNELKERLPAYSPIYLSTSIPPIERFERIDKIKSFTKTREKFFVLSTQLIEAGVDISMNKIYRDFAPLDSIIQTCGRTNRSNEGSVSEVVLFDLLDDENKGSSFSEYIYDLYLLGQSKKVLKEDYKESNTNLIPEYKLSDLSKRFLRKISKSVNKRFVLDESHNEIDLKDLIKRQEHKKLNKYFRLIEEEGTDISFFINLEREIPGSQKDSIRNSEDLWNRYEEIENTQKKGVEKYIFQKKEFEKIKRDFLEHCVTITVRDRNIGDYLSHSTNELDSVGNIFLIDNCNESEFYDIETGINLKNELF